MKIIEDFLNDYDAENSKKNYRCYLNHFFKYFNIDPEKYFSSKRNYENDVREYWHHLKEKGYARMTRNSKINCVKMFLIHNKVELPISFWKSLRKSAMDKGRRPETMDDSPTPEQLRKIIEHADTLMRAAVLTLSSSGMRISELVNLLPDDLKIENDPPMINIRAITTKTKNSRYVFISYEAKKSLEAWLRERDEWLENALKNDVVVKREFDALVAAYAAFGELILVCWCAPLPCHGEVIREFIEKAVLK